MPAIWAELVLAHFQRLQTRNAAQDFGSVSPAQSAESSPVSAVSQLYNISHVTQLHDYKVINYL
ncbi:hypothetical protein J6590_058855 [Homalodisca vitripennis]|nr:hypothetical protein J6590_058855 [Homalodisca vitripennis]